MSSPQLIIGSDFLDKVLPRIGEAKRTIDVLCFFWRPAVRPFTGPVGELLLALRDAKRRGVGVRVLTAHAGVESFMRRLGFEARRVHTRKLMHAKLMILDDRTLVVGSHNYTAAAFQENTEVSIIVELPSAENDAVVLFRNLWGF